MSRPPVGILLAIGLTFGFLLLLVARWFHFHRSPIEQVLRRAIRGSDLPPPVPQYKVFSTVNGRNRLVTIPDWAYPNLKIAIYADGWSAHGKELVAISDAKKRNFLARNGWIVLVFHGKTILGQPDYCIREIREAIRYANARRG